MRFLGNALQFAGIVLAIYLLNKIVPFCVQSSYTWIAHVFLAFNLAMWITELTQDFFFTDKVDVKYKAVLITGCDTGFGNAIAKILDLRGYRVFACCLDATCDGASELKEKCSSNLKIIQMDVTDDKSVESAVGSVENDLRETGEKRIELWAVINNAGIGKAFHTELCRMKDYEKCLQVNTLGAVRVTKAFLPFLRYSKGRVVNICSMAGRTRCPYLGPYIMSKSATIAFTEVLMQEMREHGIRVVSIEPEFFKTPMTSKEYFTNYMNETLPEIKEEITSAYGQRYIGKAKEIFWAVLSRSSPDLRRVLNDIESAVSLQNPADIYKPTRNVLIKMVFFLYDRIPRILNEIAVMLLLFIMGLPTPRTGGDLLYRLHKM